VFPLLLRLLALFVLLLRVGFLLAPLLCFFLASRFVSKYFALFVGRDDNVVDALPNESALIFFASWEHFPLRG
jgi:hypothetical protein